MRRDATTTALLIVGGLLAVAYVAAGIIGPAAGATDEVADTAFWVVLLGGGGALIALGLSLVARGASPWGAALLTSTGATAGAFALVWSIAAPLAAAVVIALSLLTARRASATT